MIMEPKKFYIAEYCDICLGEFDKLSAIIEQSQYEVHGIKNSELLDARSRFKIWLGNLGAQQPPFVQSSLDYRLREASKIKDQIIKLLQDLAEALQDGLEAYDLFLSLIAS